MLYFRIPSFRSTPHQKFLASMARAPQRAGYRNLVLCWVRDDTRTRVITPRASGEEVLKVSGLGLGPRPTELVWCPHFPKPQTLNRKP